MGDSISPFHAGYHEAPGRCVGQRIANGLVILDPPKAMQSRELFSWNHICLVTVTRFNYV